MPHHNKIQNLNENVMEAVNTIFQENVVAEIKLSYNNPVKPSLRPKIKCSEDAFKILFRNWNLENLGFLEEFKVMLLNRANQVIGICQIGVGGTNSVTADPKLIIATAIKGNASGIILAHNHPSGNLKTSEQDRRLTKRVKEVCDFLDINLLDHVILTEEGYFSFAEEGLL
jgi:DNA repair protein RadC